MSAPYPLDFDQLRRHCERAHNMSCSDPSDPSRQTSYSDTLRVLGRVDRLEGVIGVLLAALHVALDSDDPDAREGARYALQEVRDSDIAASTEARHEIREWLARGEGR